MIVSCAIRKNNQIFSAAIEKSHSYIIASNEILPPYDEGFLTDDNRFLDRKDAAVHAFDCGQIDSSVKVLLSTLLKC